MALHAGVGQGSQVDQLSPGVSVLNRRGADGHDTRGDEPDEMAAELGRGRRPHIADAERERTAPDTAWRARRNSERSCCIGFAPFIGTTRRNAIGTGGAPDCFMMGVVVNSASAVLWKARGRRAGRRSARRASASEGHCPRPVASGTNDPMSATRHAGSMRIVLLALSLLVP